MRYNRIYQEWVHVWGSRYFSRPISSFGEYLSVYQYIDQNPAKAGLVDDPGEVGVGWPLAASSGAQGDRFD